MLPLDCGIGAGKCSLLCFAKTREYPSHAFRSGFLGTRVGNGHRSKVRMRRVFVPFLLAAFGCFVTIERWLFVWDFVSCAYGGNRQDFGRVCCSDAS